MPFYKFRQSETLGLLSPLLRIKYSVIVLFIFSTYLSPSESSLQVKNENKIVIRNSHGCHFFSFKVYNQLFQEVLENKLLRRRIDRIYCQFAGRNQKGFLETLFMLEEDFLALYDTNQLKDKMNSQTLKDARVLLQEMCLASLYFITNFNLNSFLKSYDFVGRLQSSHQYTPREDLLMSLSDISVTKESDRVVVKEKRSIGNRVYDIKLVKDEVNDFISETTVKDFSSTLRVEEKLVVESMMTPSKLIKVSRNIQFENISKSESPNQLSSMKEDIFFDAFDCDNKNAIELYERGIKKNAWKWKSQ